MLSDFLQETNSDVFSQNEEFENITKGVNEVERDYPFLNESDPLKPVRDIIPNIANENVAKQTETLVYALSSMLQIAKQKKMVFNPLPPLYAHIDEDGSLLIEWIFENFRAGFNIEPDISQSGWHLVSGEQLGGNMISGNLNNIEALIPSLFKYIFIST